MKTAESNGSAVFAFVWSKKCLSDKEKFLKKRDIFQ